MKIWRVVAEGLKEKIDAVGDLNFLKSESDSTGCLVVYCLLCYPLFVCYFSDRLVNSTSSINCMEFELEPVLEVWRLLYDSASCVSMLQCSMNDFAEDLCKVQSTMLTKSTHLPQSGPESCLKENENIIFLFVYGEVAIYLLKKIQVFDSIALLSMSRETLDDYNCGHFSHIKHSLEFVKRFLTLSAAVMKANLHSELAIISRVFAAMSSFAERLCLKQDMILLMEIFSDPLIQWLSLSREIKVANALHQLQFFWTQILDCIQRIQPPIVFDSVFLEIQAPLLQIAFDHPYTPISDATVAFWRSTYGNQTKLYFPHCLLTVLDKLFRQGRISFRKGSFPVNSSAAKEVKGAEQRYQVTATGKRSSKRIEFTENNENDIEVANVTLLGSERKRLKIVEHQRKVSAAHPETKRDRNRQHHTVKTCTNIDLSLDNADTRLGYGPRNSSSILKMLRKEV